MKKIIIFCGYCFLSGGLLAQTVTQKLQRAFQLFEADPQLKHAISSLYVVDAGTGKVVFDKNSQVGLVPASTQKIITGATAFELLGKDYKYKTLLSSDGKVENGVLNGNLYLTGSGDPTFGSERWQFTKAENVLKEFTDALKAKGIKKISGTDYFLVKNFEESVIPDGWIWQDIGNYYGAGASSLNWRENQYDIILRSGIIRGSGVEVVGTRPERYKANIRSKVFAAARGTGDNAYIYLPVSGDSTIIRGTIPVGEKNFKISGAAVSSYVDFYNELMKTVQSENIEADLKMQDFTSRESIRYYLVKNLNEIYTYNSPALDSIIYWFLQKSINLYGEALIKTFAYEKEGFGSTEEGVKIIRDFWKQKGIDEDELNIGDGSGLSPQNRVTTHALVEILKYAKQQPWYNCLYDALPEYNNMKMKSGTIKGVKGFCGYHKAGNGKEYIFSFLVNNYSGSSSALVGKMYRVLNELK